ncbi:TPA: hypothetical protein DDZ86_03695 [Candidatus Dependentiae bacterium]|nr:MAG: hypothetical protein UW09_C0003G0092 [candidate division TM6 bacterium GW2011_GWF2_43_87]HBL98719.1 hypothetical protein [Candidatus Dependentiae bacterium]
MPLIILGIIIVGAALAAFKERDSYVIVAWQQQNWWKRVKALLKEALLTAVALLALFITTYLFIFFVDGAHFALPRMFNYPLALTVVYITSVLLLLVAIFGKKLLDRIIRGISFPFIQLFHLLKDALAQLFSPWTFTLAALMSYSLIFVFERAVMLFAKTALIKHPLIKLIMGDDLIANLFWGMAGRTVVRGIFIGSILWWLCVVLFALISKDQEHAERRLVILGAFFKMGFLVIFCGALTLLGKAFTVIL